MTHVDITVEFTATIICAFQNNVILDHNHLACNTSDSIIQLENSNTFDNASTTCVVEEPSSAEELYPIGSMAPRKEMASANKNGHSQVYMDTTFKTTREGTHLTKQSRYALTTRMKLTQQPNSQQIHKIKEVFTIYCTHSDIEVLYTLKSNNKQSLDNNIDVHFLLK